MGFSRCGHLRREGGVGEGKQWAGAPLTGGPGGWASARRGCAKRAAALGHAGALGRVTAVAWWATRGGPGTGGVALGRGKVG
jgi:hypothetical protein